METLVRDLRYVGRSFARSPGFFILTTLTLALGIGATTAIFSVVNGVLLQPLPYPEPDRIVQLYQLTKTGEKNSITQPNFIDWHAQNRSFSALALSTPGNTETVNGLSEPVRARTSYVSKDFFSVFGTKPVVGRTFRDEESTTGDPTTAIISAAFWQKNFGADQSVIGKKISVGSSLLTIVGVMPASMNYPTGVEIWMPHEPDPTSSRTSGGYRAHGRLKPGVTIEQARQDMSALSRRMKQQYGDETGMSDAETDDFHELLVGKIRPTLFVLLGASAFLLLIACANVVNLLVARMTIRRSEIGLRLALGASRGRVSQQFLVETSVLSLIGGVAGVALAAIGVRVLLAMQPTSIPRSGEVHVSIPVMLFALGLSVVTAVVMGLLTAWHGTRGDLRESLSASTRTQSGGASAVQIRRALVVSQMALTVVLLVGAGLLGRSFAQLLQVNPGYRTQHAVLLDAAIPYEGGDAGAQHRVAFYRDLISQLRAIPGVTKVGAVTGFPLVGGGNDGGYLIMSRPDEPLRPQDFPILWKDPKRSGHANYMVVDGDYFDAMNIPVINGRTFNSGDTPDAAHVGVISASFAKSKWPNESAIGKIIQYGNMDGDLRPFTVVGVVGDVRDQNLAADPTPTFYAYLPQRSRSGNSFHVVMQTAGDPTNVMTSARAIVRRLRPDIPPVVRTMETIVSTSVADRKFVLVLVGVFGAAALLLATLGVYSVVSYLVTQRRQEIGVRIALGAQRSDVLGLVLRQGALLAIIGIGVGTVGALALTRLLKELVFGVSTTDPIAFGGVMGLLIAVALIASWLPARRATRVDPMTALRGS
jgi:putative ABC transport system permease protein